MSKVYLTSDWHIGHKDIYKKHRTHFTSDEDHNQTILDNYRSIIRPRDVVYFMGDICFTEASLALIKALPGDKRLILGNHENQYGEFRTAQLWDVFNKIHGLYTRKGCWFSHAPIHPTELRDKFNVHGHVHANTLPDPRYANVSLENTNYYPVDFQEVKACLNAGTIFTKEISCTT